MIIVIPANIQTWVLLKRMLRSDIQIASYTEMDVWETVVKALGMNSKGDVAAELQKFYDAAHREPLYQGFYHEEDGSITPYESLFF